MEIKCTFFGRNVKTTLVVRIFDIHMCTIIMITLILLPYTLRKLDVTLNISKLIHKTLPQIFVNLLKRVHFVGVLGLPYLNLKTIEQG